MENRKVTLQNHHFVNDLLDLTFPCQNAQSYSIYDLQEVLDEL